MAGTYQDLKVWQLAMEMVFQVYRCTVGFPKQEFYGLTSQMRRSAVSVPSNIAEGKGRFSRKELVHYLFSTNSTAFSWMPGSSPKPVSHSTCGSRRNQVIWRLA
jgi:23S rRNA-intervening sequence protein